MDLHLHTYELLHGSQIGHEMLGNKNPLTQIQTCMTKCDLIMFIGAREKNSNYCKINYLLKSKFLFTSDKKNQKNPHANATKLEM